MPERGYYLKGKKVLGEEGEFCRYILTKLIMSLLMSSSLDHWS